MKSQKQTERQFELAAMKAVDTFADHARIKRAKWVEQALIDQRTWIKDCGGTEAGYIANYHGRHGRSVDDAMAIYQADMAFLRRLEAR